MRFSKRLVKRTPSFQILRSARYTTSMASRALNKAVGEADKVVSEASQTFSRASEAMEEVAAVAGSVSSRQTMFSGSSLGGATPSQTSLMMRMISSWAMLDSSRDSKINNRHRGAEILSAAGACLAMMTTSSAVVLVGAVSAEEAVIACSSRCTQWARWVAVAVASAKCRCSPAALVACLAQVQSPLKLASKMASA